jgi:hypothetical protein
MGINMKDRMEFLHRPRRYAVYQTYLFPHLRRKLGTYQFRGYEHPLNRVFD